MTTPESPNVFTPVTTSVITPLTNSESSKPDLNLVPNPVFDMSYQPENQPEIDQYGNESLYAEIVPIDENTTPTNKMPRTSTKKSLVDGIVGVIKEINVRTLRNRNSK